MIAAFIFQEKGMLFRLGGARGRGNQARLFQIRMKSTLFCFSPSEAATCRGH